MAVEYPLSVEAQKMLVERVDDHSRLILHLCTLFTGQRINEMEIRRLVEKLGAHTRINVPDWIKL
jgi:hypothetical protein